MRLIKWLICLTMLIQIGPKSFVDPREVVGMTDVLVGGVKIYLRGGGFIYSTWSIPKIMSELFDKDILERQRNPIGSTGFKAENDAELEAEIRRYNPNTIFEPKSESESFDVDRSDPTAK